MARLVPSSFLQPGFPVLFIPTGTIALLVSQDLFCSCASVSACIPLPSRLTQVLMINSSTEHEISVIDLLDFSRHCILAYIVHYSFSIFFPMYRQHGKQDPLQPSWTPPEIGHPFVNVVQGTCSPYSIFASLPGGSTGRGCTLS
ncbi:hypothetical protein FB451DRAFT_162123 [Mycena latifolia]|nr:hypothetical protein FB451DRAFT_162123 [Mycena latifolia]